MEFPTLETSVGKKANEPIGVTQNGGDQVGNESANVPNGVDYNIWLPLALVHEVNDRMKNSLYRFLIGKRLTFPFASIEGVEYVLRNGRLMIRGIPIFHNKWCRS
ncbi:hypothetical protein Tco_1103681 [Tanacetum coccineum]